MTSPFLPSSSSDSSLSISKSNQQLALHHETESHSLALLTLKTNEVNTLRATCEALEQQVADLQHVNINDNGKQKGLEGIEEGIVSQQFTSGPLIPFTHAPQDDLVLQELRQQNFDLQQHVASLQFNIEDDKLKKKIDDLFRDLEPQKSTQTDASKTEKDAQGQQDESNNIQMDFHQNNIVATLIADKAEMQTEILALRKKVEGHQEEEKHLNDCLDKAEEQVGEMNQMIEFGALEMTLEQRIFISSYIASGGLSKDYKRLGEGISSAAAEIIARQTRVLELTARELTTEQYNRIESYANTDGLSEDYEPYGQGLTSLPYESDESGSRSMVVSRHAGTSGSRFGRVD